MKDVDVELLQVKSRLWQDNRFVAVSPLINALLAALVLAYAVLAIGYGDVAEKLRHLLLLTAIWMFIYGRRQIRRSPVFWLLLLAVLLPLASWAFSLLTHPEWAERSPKVNRVTGWLLPIVIAYAVGGSTRNTWSVWAAGLIGLLAATWLGGGFSEIGRGLHGARVDFHLHNAQHATMYFAVALLGLIVFLPRLSARVSPRWLVVSGWLLVAAVTAVCIAVTQTRGVWLGLLVALLAMVWMFAARQRRHHLWLTLVLLIGLVSLVVLLGRSELVEQRVEADRNTITTAMQGQLGELPFDSPGIRLRTWVDAIDWIERRPLLGWGGNGRGLVLEHSAGYPDWLRANTHHLHNSYLDTLVNYGVVGLTLLVGLWGWLIVAASRAYRRGDLPRDMWQFFIAFMLFWSVINCFESYIYFSSGIFVFGLVAGGVLSHIWLRHLTASAVADLN